MFRKGDLIRRMVDTGGSKGTLFVGNVYVVDRCEGENVKLKGFEPNTWLCQYFELAKESKIKRLLDKIDSNEG